MQKLIEYLDELAEKYGFTEDEKRKCASLLRSVQDEGGKVEESDEFEGEDVVEEQ